jgi:hypothetical protein
MFPALPDTRNVDTIPSNVDARAYTNLEALLPILVRKSTQDSWNARADFDIAALEVFDEIDGIHSFYHIPTLNALAAVAAFMTRHQSKRRAAYFFALPDALILEHALGVSEALVDNSNCQPLHDLHRHVNISGDRKVLLFREIQEAQLYNFRIGKNAMNEMEVLLRARNCRDYSDGTCECEAIPQI